MSKSNCEVEDCGLRAYIHYVGTDLSLCRWHAYLFEKAGEAEHEPTCQRLLKRLPPNKRAAEESVRHL